MCDVDDYVDVVYFGDDLMFEIVEFVCVWCIG